MGYAIQDWHIAFVQFTFVQFTEWKTRLTSGCFYFYIQVLLFILEIFCLGKTKIALPFTVQLKLPHFFFGNGKHSQSTLLFYFTTDHYFCDITWCLMHLIHPFIHVFLPPWEHFQYNPYRINYAFSYQ